MERYYTWRRCESFASARTDKSIMDLDLIERYDDTKTYMLYGMKHHFVVTFLNDQYLLIIGLLYVPYSFDLEMRTCTSQSSHSLKSTFNMHTDVPDSYVLMYEWTHVLHIFIFYEFCEKKKFTFHESRSSWRTMKFSWCYHVKIQTHPNPSKPTGRQITAMI